MPRSTHVTTANGSIERLAGMFRDLAAQREPKFLKLRATLLQGIEAGLLRPGDRLPSDVDLAGAFQVSLGTVQKALSVLSEESVVSRRQGVGTTIESHRVELKDVWHFRFVGPDRKTLLPLTAKALSVRRIRERGPWTEHIGADRSYVRVQRLITVNARFNVFSEVFLGNTRFGDLVKLRRSEFDRVILRNLLVERYNLPILRPSQLLSCVRLPDAVCKILGVARRTPGIFLEVVGFDHYNAPVYYQRVYWPASASPLLIG
jgi:GntR family transcriptional regulator